MKPGSTAARLGRRLLGERYGAFRFLLLRAQVGLKGTTARDRFEQAFADREGSVIRRGLFGGMRFFKRIPGSTTVIPILLGSYEEELQPVLEEAIADDPRLVVNIGSAEGYYAVGLARRLPHSRVVAFDINPVERHMCRRLARLNGVDARIEVRAACSAAYLSTLPPRSLVVSDCEGAEKDLLDTERAPALKAATIIVEVHDSVDPTISETLKRRFKPSHRIEEIHTRARDPSLYEELGVYSEAEAARAVSEDRGGDMTWLVMRPAPA